MYKVLSKAGCTPRELDKPRSRTRQHRREVRKERRQEGSSRHAHRRERQEVRRERRKEGGRKKEKGADEAGKTSTELYQRFTPGCVYLYWAQVLALWTDRC